MEGRWLNSFDIVLGILNEVGIFWQKLKRLIKILAFPREIYCTNGIKYFRDLENSNFDLLIFMQKYLRISELFLIFIYTYANNIKST